MEQITVRNLTFSYDEESSFCLNNLSFSVRKGEVLLLIGESGCGKTTLLKHLKTDLLPQGKRSGKSKILIDGKSLSDMSERERAGKIGFVRQNAEGVQATDKVWHELAFGLESLGYPQPVMQQKAAEMAAFFGLERIYYEPLSNLSGGEKQLVNLASVMVMEPELLILDEPTSQLDPIAATEFFQIIGKINKELGTTILMTEHRLEEAFSFCDRVMVMERGNILFTDLPEHVVRRLYQEGKSLYKALPTPARLYLELEGDGTGKVPLTVREGNVWMEEFCKKHPREDIALPESGGEIKGWDISRQPGKNGKKERALQEYAFSAEELWFRYEREGKDILTACSIAPQKGKITAILGGNGAGKSTLLHVLAGHEVPYRGKIRRMKGRMGILPQNPQAMFAKKTVLEELRESVKYRTRSRDEAGKDVEANIEEEQREVKRITAFCGLENLLCQHPYDLSGGEMQKLALAKLLLADYDILLLDEPGKGMDYAFKEEMGKCLRTLVSDGRTVLLVSHDVEFCARYADRCGLFFDGHVVSLEDTGIFFMQNVFYTTVVRRMCRESLPEAVIREDVLKIFGDRKSLNSDIRDRDAKQDENNNSTNGRGAGRQKRGCRNIGVTDQEEITDQEIDWKKTPEMENETDWKTDRTGKFTEKKAIKSEADKQFHRWSLGIPAMILFLVMPLTIYFGETVLQQRKYYFISLLLLLEAIAVFFLSFEKKKPKIREIMVVAMLCAITVAGRAAFYMVPNVKPVAALVILSGVGLGGETGFLVGAMSMLVSNIFFGQGPWTPWQMFAMGLLGFVAGIVFKQNSRVTKRKKYGICFFGFVAVMLIYGGIMNPASVLMYQENVNWQMILTAYSMGIPFDVIHALATFVFLWIGTRPMLEKMERIKKKYGFDRKNI